ncbi:hypothetical protein BG011_009085 [Mortierella polycephala]|uniref:Uncharacterized protein n=1 Tax=Mortierella polycephala TaxID=41804 RepID=A0A9P6U7Q8_9FUNG|nr:hypothetical protein BG011_009085 [Mortierella polycephala]
MQFKTLTLAAAIAVASVSAQFAQDPCADCVYASFGNDTLCASLPPKDMEALTLAFQPGSVDAKIIVAEMKKPATKDCLCSWSKDTFSATGAARDCVKTEAPVCDAKQLADGQLQLDSMKGLLTCGATPSGSAPSPTGSETPESAAGSLSISMPYVLSVAALGLAALAGL